MPPPWAVTKMGNLSLKLPPSEIRSMDWRSNDSAVGRVAAAAGGGIVDVCNGTV